MRATITGWALPSMQGGASHQPAPSGSPVLGMAVIAAFIPYYGLPIRGEIAGATPTARRDRGGP